MTPLFVAAVLSAWLQYGADGEPYARAVVSDAACPAASADGRALRMKERAARTAEFGDVVCEAAIPHDARRARVDGVRRRHRPVRRGLRRPAHRRVRLGGRRGPQGRSRAWGGLPAAVRRRESDGAAGRSAAYRVAVATAPARELVRHPPPAV